MSLPNITTKINQLCGKIQRLNKKVTNLQHFQYILLVDGVQTFEQGTPSQEQELVFESTSFNNISLIDENTVRIPQNGFYHINFTFPCEMAPPMGGGLTGMEFFLLVNGSIPTDVNQRLHALFFTFLGINLFINLSLGGLVQLNKGDLISVLGRIPSSVMAGLSVVVSNARGNIYLEGI